MKMSNGVEGSIVLGCRGAYWARNSDLVVSALMVVSFKGIDRRVSESKEGHARITNILRSGEKRGSSKGPRVSRRIIKTLKKNIKKLLCYFVLLCRN